MDTAGVNRLATQARTRLGELRRITPSLTLKLAALCAIFIALPLILYGEFETADRHTRELALKAQNVETATPFRNSREVRQSAAIYLAMSVVFIVIAFSIRQSLRRFAKAAEEAGDGRIGGDAVAARNGVPELSGVARRIDALLLELHRTADQIRSSAEENAHSIKTPLATIKSSLAPLRRALAAEDMRTQRALGNIDRSITRLYTIVMAAQQIDIGTADLISTPRDLVNLTTLVGDATLACRHIVAEGHIRLTRRLDDDILVRASRGPLEVALQIILDNALVYSPERGTIVFTLTGNGGKAHLEIEDEGPGIDPDKLAYIFERNSSATLRNGDIADHLDHAGLGLWITKRNIEALGGEVTARNRDPSGLSVSIILPRALDTK